MARIPEPRLEPIEQCDAVMFDDEEHPIYEGDGYWMFDGICYCEECMKERMRLA